jgi:hypothetical protein
MATLLSFSSPKKRPAEPLDGRLLQLPLFEASTRSDLLEVIRTLLALKFESRMINHVEIYMKLACAQRDYHNILGIIDVLQAVEQSLKGHFTTTCAQSEDVLLLVKDGQIQYLEFATNLLHHLRKTIRFKPNVSSTTLIFQGKFNLECLELLSSLPKIADPAHDLKVKNQLEKQHRVRPLKPGDHVALYPPESTFASRTYLEVRVQLPKIWRAAWINTKFGSVKTSPRTHQKNQPTGSASSASTSLGPNKALTDFFSKYRKVRILSVNQALFAKRLRSFSRSWIDKLRLT